MTTHFIYILWQKTESDIFYVGVTCNPKMRANEHRKSNTGGLNGNFNYSIIDQIECSNKSRDYFVLEEYWISQFRAWGFNLVNSRNQSADKKIRKISGTLNLKDIPPDVYRYLRQKQGENRVETVNSAFSLRETIIKIIREHRDLLHTNEKIA